MKRLLSSLAGVPLLLGAGVAQATTPNGHIVPDEVNLLRTCRPGNEPTKVCPAIDNSGKSLRALHAYPRWNGKRGYGIRVRVPQGHTTDALYYDRIDRPASVWFFQYLGLGIPGMRKNEQVKFYYLTWDGRWVVRCKPKGDKHVKVPGKVNEYTSVIVRVVTSCRNRG